jgi:polyisoprenyl-phosphate glycosyltransferase
MKLNRTPHIEIVLPIYNEVNNILPLLEECDKVIEELKGNAVCTFLFINDGSKDGSKELLQRVYQDRSDVRVINLIHNFGHSSALAAGINHFDADIAVFMDADMQDSPNGILTMFDKWKEGATTIVAERGKRAEKSSMLFRLFYLILHKIARDLPPISFGTYCLLDRTVIERMRLLLERNRYFPGLVSYSSDEIVPIQIERHARLSGSSRVGTLGLINLAITAFLSFSNVPIRLVSIMGLASAGTALIAGAIFICVKVFTNSAIPGWASMMTAIAFASGLQLLCLGIIGEYIARIFQEVKGRPLYLVGKVLDRTAVKAAKEQH